MLYQHYTTICTFYTNTIQLYVHFIPTLFTCTFYTNTIHMYKLVYMYNITLCSAVN